MHGKGDDTVVCNTGPVRPDDAMNEGELPFAAELRCCDGMHTLGHVTEQWVPSLPVREEGVGVGSQHGGIFWKERVR